MSKENKSTTSEFDLYESLYSQVLSNKPQEVTSKIIEYLHSANKRTYFWEGLLEKAVVNSDTEKTDIYISSVYIIETLLFYGKFSNKGLYILLEQSIDIDMNLEI